MSELQPFNTMFPGYYQTAYVTKDVDLAMTQIGSSYRIKNWYRNPEFVMATRDGKTCSFRVALAFIGDSQIEIIEPTGGDDGIYRDYLRERGSQLAFHHVCKAFDTEEQYMENLSWLKREGVNLPVLVANEIAHACYADFREKLGHYLEFVWYTNEGKAFMKAIPRNS